MCAVHDRSMCAIVSNGAIACVRPSATWTADRPPSVRKSSTFLIAKGFQGQSRARDTPCRLADFVTDAVWVGGVCTHPSIVWTADRPSIVRYSSTTSIARGFRHQSRRPWHSNFKSSRARIVMDLV